MRKIRDSAKGEECTLMIAPYCNHNPETVVLCHLPSLEKGLARKGSDHWAVYGCSACHDILDQRNPRAIREIGWSEVVQCMFRALERTQQRLIEKGLMKVAK
jgi:hypothetical protein